MRNYGQVIHKIIQRGNSNMAAVSKDVTLYGFWASSGTFYSLAPFKVDFWLHLNGNEWNSDKRPGESGQPWFTKI